MTRETDFTPADRGQLALRGISEEEARRQLWLISAPPGWADLVRPCTPGDGIVRLDEDRMPTLHEAHARAAAAGEVTSFVPASGAATRMFRELHAALALPGDLAPEDVRAAAAAGGREAAALAAFADGLPRFAFRDTLAAVLAERGRSLDELRERGPWRPLAEALLSPTGLDYDALPKGLLEFHRAPGGARTPFEEHLQEAALFTRDSGGRARAHFTVSPEHRRRFEALLTAVAPGLAASTGATAEVSFSEQHPDTDTLAGDPAGGPFRDDAGRLLFRPAGHGALLRNLAESGLPFAFVKNVDNVAVERVRPETLRWSRALVGLAAELRGRTDGLLERLEDPRDVAVEAEARAFLHEAYGDPEPPGDRPALVARLDRPLRVCGMVPNTGEPGGGPFWVRARDGHVTRQVVETSQVDPASGEKRAILARATHFNPVFFACALRGPGGRAYPLADFVDETAVIVTRRSAGGRELLALERPGLWNGAMAGWNTVFVEAPLAVFNPVKTVLDLLRPEHQA